MNRNRGMNQKKFIPDNVDRAFFSFAIVKAAAGISASVAEAKTVTGDGYTLDAPTGWKVTHRDNKYTSVDNVLKFNKGGKSGSIQNRKWRQCFKM